MIVLPIPILPKTHPQDTLRTQLHLYIYDSHSVSMSKKYVKRLGLGLRVLLLTISHVLTYATCTIYIVTYIL